MAMSMDCTKAPGMRRKPDRLPPLSATATLIFTPSSAAFATAASRATLTASAETTDWGTATVETGFWLMLGSRKSYIRL